MNLTLSEGYRLKKRAYTAQKLALPHHEALIIAPGTRERVRALGCKAPDDLSCRSGDVDDQTRWRWVTGGRRIATIWPELGERWQCWHRVLMPGWGGDREFIRCTTVGPAPIFLALITSAA